MLVQIAWRNIWRNKTRSFVVIGSIVVGLWASIFILAFAWGLYKNNIDESVNRQLSHIQVHHPGFADQQESKYVIKNSDSILSMLKKDDMVQSASMRTIVKGMITSPTTVSGVTIYGISPKTEIKQIGLNQNLIEGDYFASGKDNEIFIGEKLAKKLKIKLRSKVVVTFTDIHASIVSGAFRVGGIYRSRNLSLDEVNVYVQKQSLDNLLGLQHSQSNELAILLKDESALDSYITYVRQLMPNQKVEDWKDLAPDLELVIESFNLYTYIISGIILLALTFGIVNTMLMSVLERIRELGMLMAIGLNKRKIFLMIMLETLFLTLIGCPVGLLVGWLSVLVLGTYGINIAIFSEGLASYGFSSIIYPALDSQNYWIVAIMCLITALLSAIYPAYRALQLNPAESIRKI
ncbi:ABC transporter permease [[Muricauda] lutisoli]|uniref:ABC transporter permease n=1 Tax=[Muricauda] lutisoli TaxID=2816035 RepID=A0ABS3EVS4_9FLAO|nr:FtsX-like permease family protein [[Muricauda] lutisoli]MBO0330346.1 ABC transporter permease [[Muricauda] lutisoli]